MRILSRFIILLVILSFHSLPLRAEFDLIGNASLSLPTGGLRSYAYGAAGIGGTVRVATNINSYTKFFLQGTYADFGIEKGLTGRDNVFSDSELESVTDMYSLSICPGISIGKNLDGLIPYVNIAGGINYYSSLSRISSLQYSQISEQFENSGITWRAGGGFGMRYVGWKPDDGSGPHLIDMLLIDIRLDYFMIGEVEFLDMRTVRYKSNALQYETSKKSGGVVLMNFGLVFKF